MQLKWSRIDGVRKEKGNIKSSREKKRWRKVQEERDQENHDYDGKMEEKEEQLAVSYTHLDVYKRQFLYLNNN